MKQYDDEMRAEYLREELGNGVRGKYFKRAAQGTKPPVLLQTEQSPRPTHPRPARKKTAG